VARNKDLVAKSPFLRVGGEGAVDIGRSRVDYLARATVTGTPEARAAPSWPR
jgi:AsmA protein